jgi:uncharacterized membrane protein YphA (DoxX/SURF4 family)
MSHHTLRRTFVLFHLTLGAVIFIQSLITFWHAAHPQKSGHHNIALAAFAAAEAVAALLFLLPFAIRWAGACLLLIFAAATLIHLATGEFPSTLLVYAAGVSFVMAHGSAYGKDTQLNQTPAH